MARYTLVYGVRLIPEGSLKGVDGATLTTRVDAASDPARLGSDQVRQVSFDGDLMVLRPRPRSNGEHRVLTWEKISDV